MLVLTLADFLCSHIWDLANLILFAVTLTVGTVSDWLPARV